MIEAAKPAAIILAAGASRRMGRVKALLEYKGETFLGRLSRILSESGCDPVIVVIPPSGLTCPPGVTCTVNPMPDRGMLTSLQCGIRALPDTTTAVLFTPVDLPAVIAGTVKLLVAASASDALLMPRHRGQRGHPVALGRRFFQEFLSLPSGARTREIVDRHVDEVRYFDVDDSGILTDIDEPADYERLRGGATP